MSKKNECIVYRCDGPNATIEPSGKYFSLKELQDCVAEGGNIDIVNFGSGQVFIVDDVGRFKNTYSNMKVFEKFGVRLYGDVLVCPESLIE